MQRQIDEAIRRAVREYEQPPELATKIIAWMKALSGGNELIDDGQRARQRVDVLYEATKICDVSEDE